MLFCPHCANILIISGWDDAKGAGGVAWTCMTCPYSHQIDRVMLKAVHLDPKKLDAVEMEENNMAFDSNSPSELLFRTEYIRFSYLFHDGLVFRDHPKQ